MPLQASWFLNQIPVEGRHTYQTSYAISMLYESRQTRTKYYTRSITNHMSNTKLKTFIRSERDKA